MAPVDTNPTGKKRGIANQLSSFGQVHQSCLQRWVDEKQKGNSFKRVNCPQCQSEYIIVFPAMGTFVSILEGVDSLIKRLSPFLAAGVLVGSLYWTAVTYGAVTVSLMPLYGIPFFFACHN